MKDVIDARARLENLVHIMKTSGGLKIDAEIVESNQARAAHVPVLCINLSGEDALLFVSDDGALLKAVQHVSTVALRLEETETELLWFDVHPQNGGRSESRCPASDAVAHA